MLNDGQLVKRKQEIELHRRVLEKKHPYLLRIPQSDFEKLQEIAGNESMSKVLIRGLRTEINYHAMVQDLMKKLPKFVSTQQLDGWKFKHLKNCPELLSKYVMPATIKAYLDRQEQHDKLQQLALIQWNSIVYYLNRIGINLNQVAHRANQGVEVDVKELQKITKAIMGLSKLINQKFKESGADVCQK
ncbi:MobC family plasmid mobilization relaxosome protein [Limosilactobacillus fermentum]|uniref:MobC family plasmid mobilization relaxosome protein n=1 Tax=Limosilactobacillus fermentum TaxID=1613 RepID=UPI0021F11BE2|nr:MobC family plasmid mobilization relaxosome protein [Limosilactobacillus fermentum]